MRRLSRGWAQALILAVLLVPWLSCGTHAHAKPFSFPLVGDVFEILPKTGGLAELATASNPKRTRAQSRVAGFGEKRLGPSILAARPEHEIKPTGLIAIDRAAREKHGFELSLEVACGRLTAHGPCGVPQTRFALEACGRLTTHGRSWNAIMRGSDGNPALARCHLLEAGDCCMTVFGLFGPPRAIRSLAEAQIPFLDPLAPAEGLVARLPAAGAHLIAAPLHNDLTFKRALPVEGRVIARGGDPITVSEPGGLSVKYGSGPHDLAAPGVHFKPLEWCGRKWMVWTPDSRYRSKAGVGPGPQA